MKLQEAPDSDQAGSASFACVASAWQAHEGELRGYLRHRRSDSDAADDVLQNVFVKCKRQGSGVCTLDNPRAWLFQVARNALVDRARTDHSTEALSDELAEVAREPETPLAPVDASAECVISTLAEPTHGRLPRGRHRCRRQCTRPELGRRSRVRAGRWPTWTVLISMRPLPSSRWAARARSASRKTWSTSKAAPSLTATRSAPAARCSPPA